MEHIKEYADYNEEEIKELLKLFYQKGYQIGSNSQLEPEEILNPMIIKPFEQFYNRVKKYSKILK